MHCHRQGGGGGGGGSCGTPLSNIHRPISVVGIFVAWSLQVGLVLRLWPGFPFVLVKPPFFKFCLCPKMTRKLFVPIEIVLTRCLVLVLVVCGMHGDELDR